MDLFGSEKEAAIAALLELKAMLPAAPSSGDRQWGTIIYRFKRADIFWYTYEPIYPGDPIDRIWSPAPRSSGSCGQRAVCLTHPNNSPITPAEIALATGAHRRFPRCTVYVVNQTGAYWYNGRVSIDPRNADTDDAATNEWALEAGPDRLLDECGHGLPPNAAGRFGTLWGIDHRQVSNKFHLGKRCDDLAGASFAIPAL